MMRILLSSFRAQFFVLLLFVPSGFVLAQDPSSSTNPPGSPPGGPPTQPLDASVSFQEPSGYSFNPLAVKRDPFVPPQVDQRLNVNELERYDLNQMKLVAIMEGFGKPQAMIILPDNKTYILREGDVIGRRNGVVARITSTEVQVKESFRDFQNRVKSDVTALVLAQ
jgi:hypothetical protein